MQKDQPVANFCFLLATGLISLFAYTLLVSAFSFIIGFSISRWQLPVALLLVLITQFKIAHSFSFTEPKCVFLKSSGLLIIIIMLSIIISGSIYDVSFDGQWYHQETVYQLNNGWNPYHRELPVPKIPGVPDAAAIWCSGPHVDPTENSNGLQPIVYIKYISINYFAKGAEIFEASVYAFTKRIECGKSINLMMFIASFFLCLCALFQMEMLTTGKKWMIAILLACNPVTIYQLTSYCLDGLMASLLISLIALFIIILKNENKYSLLLFGLLVMILVNVKFTAIPFAGVMCIGFICFLAIRKKKLLLKKTLLTGSISFVIGFLFIGFHPYMTNQLSHGHIFHGLKETKGEIYAISPSYLKDKNRFINFFISNGARSYDQAANDSSITNILKIPFTVNRRELQNANNPEIEVAGFGPFFGGALLISIILLALITMRHFKQTAFKTGGFVLGFLLLSIFIMPEPWWARFAPQSWLLPVFILILSEVISSRKRFLKLVLYVSLFLNVLWATSGIFLNIRITSHINYQIAQLKTLDQPISVEYCGYRDLRTNRIRFYENNIPFIERNVRGGHIYNVIHSNTRFECARELPELPKSFLMKLGGE